MRGGFNGNRKGIRKSPAKYFHDEMGFKRISEDQAFYVNNANEIDVVFDEHEIAPGSSEEPEFIIEE